MSHSCVAVIIAGYNVSSTIQRAIASALMEQEVSEVFFVDDGSTDDTLIKAKQADDGSGRLKLIALPVNGGPSHARNRALSSATAPWISILDADDFFLPKRIKGLLCYAEDADFIADDIWRVNEIDIEGPRTPFLGLPEDHKSIISLKDFALSNIPDKKHPRRELGFIKPLMRRSFIEKHNLRYQEHMRLGEDYELYARALALGARFLLVPAQGYVAVVRQHSLSGLHSEKDLMHFRDCDQKLALIPGLNAEEMQALHRHYLSTDCRLQWRLLIRAVKNRDAIAALKTLIRPFPVPFYLFQQLCEQFIIRLSRKLKS